jgi:hypothetical protein
MRVFPDAAVITISIVAGQPSLRLQWGGGGSVWPPVDFVFRKEAGMIDAANREPRMGVSLNSSARDRRIDFWRGLCLIDMVLVHLYYENVRMGDHLGKILGEYSRFAAGGFVFVSGMAMGAIFLAKSLEPGRRWGTYRRLWARSLRILEWQYLVAIAWVGLTVWRGSHAPVTSLGQLLFSVLTFREGGDLLPLYVILIGLTPLLLECRRRLWSAWALAVCSIGIFIFGRFHPYALSVDPQGNFPPLLWQLVFISGLFAGSALKRYDALSVKAKLSISTGAWTLFALLFWCEYWYPLGLPRCPVSLTFTKVPLTTGELLRYLSMTIGLISATDLVWSRIAKSYFTSFAATLGRSSLPVYVLHTFVIEFAGWLAVQPRIWAIGQWQLLFVPACLLPLWLLAVALQSRKNRAKPVAVIWPAAMDRVPNAQPSRA